MMPADRDLVDTLLAIALTPLVCRGICECGHPESHHDALGRCHSCGCSIYFPKSRFSARVEVTGPKSPQPTTREEGILRAGSPSSLSEASWQK